MENILKNIEYKEEFIGAKIKQSKKSIKWIFDYSFSSYIVEIQDSRVSCKRRLFINNNLIKEVTDFLTPFSHQFEIKDLKCIVLQYGDGYDFRIESESFNHILNLKKTRKEFEKVGPTVKSNKNEQMTVDFNIKKGVLGADVMTGKYYKKEEQKEKKEKEEETEKKSFSIQIKSIQNEEEKRKKGFSQFNFNKKSTLNEGKVEEKVRTEDESQIDLFGICMGNEVKTQNQEENKEKQGRTVDVMDIFDVTSKEIQVDNKNKDKNHTHMNNIDDIFSSISFS